MKILSDGEIQDLLIEMKPDEFYPYIVAQAQHKYDMEQMAELVDKYIGDGFYEVDAEFSGEIVTVRCCSADLKQVWGKLRQELNVDSNPQERKE